MKNATPEKVAIWVSAVLAGISLVLSMVLWYVFEQSLEILPSLLVGLLTFATSFFLIRFAMERFIYRKIKLIYKTIHDAKFTRDQDVDGLSRVTVKKDILTEAKREVEDWASDQRKEIDQLKALENYRKEFLGNVSHELKTPIFNIQGYVLTLLDGGLEDESINRKYLERTEKSVERMINIVQDLESITRLETSELELEMEKFDLVALAREVFEAMELRSAEKNIELAFKENSDKPIWVMADKEMIRQVVTNLVVNSIRYGREDGRTEIRFNDMDNKVLVEVSDTGIGISRENVSRIFERFFRTDKSRSRELGGTGLGLAIVKHLIEAHNETISVRSTEDVGSTFSFTLNKA